jgi:hypothetical protein
MPCGGIRTANDSHCEGPQPRSNLTHAAGIASGYRPRNDMLIPPPLPKLFRKLKKCSEENAKPQNDFAREIGNQNKLQAAFCKVRKCMT